MSTIPDLIEQAQAALAEAQAAMAKHKALFREGRIHLDGPYVAEGIEAIRKHFADTQAEEDRVVAAIDRAERLLRKGV